jgi:hypothetical protein
MISGYVLQHDGDGLATLARDQFGNALTRKDNFSRLDRDVAGGTGHSAAGLMDQESRIGETETTLAGCREIHMSGGASYPSASYHSHRGPHEADQVVNSVARFKVAAGSVTRHAAKTAD